MELFRYDISEVIFEDLDRITKRQGFCVLEITAYGRVKMLSGDFASRFEWAERIALEITSV